MSLNYEIVGGSISLASQKWVAVQNSANNSEFRAGADGYTKLTLPVSYETDGASYLTEEGFADYSVESTERGVSTYALSVGENSTRYGVIPEAYADAQKYPLLLFKDGLFLGGYDTWRNAATAAQNAVSGVAHLGDEVQILLRRDYQNNEAGPLLNLFTNILVDLGGYTFYNKEVTFDLYGNNNTAPFVSKLTVRNGKFLNVRGIPLVDVQYSAGQTQAKKYETVFENVEFGYAEEMSETLFGRQMLLTVWNNNRNDVGAQLDLIYNDCTFNLRDHFISGTVTLWGASDGYDRAHIAIRINGGRFLTGADSTVSVLTKNAGSDSLTVGRGTDGEYPILAISDGSAPLDHNFVNDAGTNLHFTAAGTSGDDAIYRLTVNELATEYGVIGSAYASAESYPFALFKNGSFVGAYDKYSTAMSNAISQATGNASGVQLLLRRDFRVEKTDKSSLQTLDGRIRLDLGGNTLSFVGYWLDQYLGTANMAKVCSFNVANGTLLSTSTTPLIGFNQASGTSDATKIYNLLFEDVTVKGQTAGGNGVLVDCWDNNTLQSSVSLTFRNCTFDYTGLKSGAIMIDAGTAKKVTAIAISVIGGKIVADAPQNFVFCTLGTEDSVLFLPGDGGLYTALDTPSGQTNSPKSYPTPDGVRYFTEYEIDEETGRSTYRLENLSTAYGTVPASTISAHPEYLSAVTYPFLLFLNGEFKRVDTTWGLATAHVKDYLYGASTGEAQIVLRRDYTTVSGEGNSGYLSYIGGVMTVDLNGYTLTAGATYIYDAYARGTDLDKNSSTTDDIIVHPTTIITKNGTIENNLLLSSGGYPIMNFNQGNNATVKQFNFTFENIVFTDKAGQTSNLILACWDNGSRSALSTTPRTNAR